MPTTVERVALNGLTLHSARDPRREAQRFVARNLPVRSSERAGTTVIVGDALGVCARALHEREPAERIITIVPPVSTAPRHFIGTRVAERPGQRLRARLRDALPRVGIGSVRVLSWPATERAAPDWVAATSKTLNDALRDVVSEVATIGSFGTLWIRNALVRTITTDTFYVPTVRASRLIVAGSGPSLDSWVTTTGAPLIAASSAVSALAARGVTADLVVHTDGGHWASRYLAAVERLDPSVPVAMPLFASRGRVRRPVPIVTGWLGEEILPDRDVALAIPDAPTVAASALQLARRLAPATPIHTVGIDLATRDLASHARGHQNDAFVALRTSRVAPDVAIRAMRVPPGAEAIVWPDGTPGYRASSASPFADAIAAAAGAASVTSDRSSPLASVVAGFTRSATPPGAGSVEVRAVHRPPREVRVAAARRALADWRRTLSYSSALDGRRGVQLALHLAPVAALSDPQHVRSEALAALARLEHLVDRLCHT